MSYKTNNLKMLPVNKTVVFKTPLENEEEVLCRTGTVAEGSCFFHSLLQAISKEYQTMDIDNKMKFVSKLRNKIASKFNEENWENINDGILSKITFQEKVIKNFNDVYLYFSKNKIKHKRTKEILKTILDKYDYDNNNIITELVNLEMLESNILPKSYDESENLKIEETIELVIKNSVDYLLKRPEFKNLEEEKTDFLIKVLIDMFISILRSSKDDAFNEYVEKMRNPNEDVDTYTLSEISDKFNRDIYFINGNTKLPYNNFSTTSTLKKRKSIIIIWVGGNHYEIIGRLLPDNIVQREFKPTDVLIDKMYTFLIDPKEINKKYPELEAYIPKEHRKQKSPNAFKFAYLSDSGSEESYSSDDSEEDYYGGYHRSASRRSERRRKKFYK